MNSSRAGNLQYKIANNLKTATVELDIAKETLDLPLTLGKLNLILTYKMGHHGRDFGTFQE